MRQISLGPGLRIRRVKMNGNWLPKKGRGKNPLSRMVVILLLLLLTILWPMHIEFSWKLSSVMEEHNQYDTQSQSDKNWKLKLWLELISSNVSLQWWEMMSTWPGIKLRWNVIWPQPESKGPRALDPLQLKSRRRRSGSLVKRLGKH